MNGSSRCAAPVSPMPSASLPLEGVVDLPATQLQAADPHRCRAIPLQLAVAAGCWRTCAGLAAHLPRSDQAEETATVCAARMTISLTHHHRHRGAAHRVDGNRLRVVGAADHHPLVGAHAVVPRR